MATIKQRTAGQHRAGEHRDCAERSENIVRRGPDKNDRQTVSLRRRRRNVAWHNRRSAAGTWNRRWRSAVVRFDPKNPQIVYSASVVCWKSTDGGKTWDGWRGAPGGDDYQNVWINPNNSD